MSADPFGGCLKRYVDPEFEGPLINGTAIAIINNCSDIFRLRQRRDGFKILKGKITGIRRFKIDQGCIWQNGSFKVFNFRSVYISRMNPETGEDHIKHPLCPGIRLMNRYNMIAGLNIRQYRRKNCGCPTIKYQAIFSTIQCSEFFPKNIYCWIQAAAIE